MSCKPDADVMMCDTDIFIYLEIVDCYNSTYTNTGYNYFLYVDLCIAYFPFNMFWKGLFYLALYSQEQNLQTFVMIKCKTICHNDQCTKSFILVIGFEKLEYFYFSLA